MRPIKSLFIYDGYLSVAVETHIIVETSSLICENDGVSILSLKINKICIKINKQDCKKALRLIGCTISYCLKVRQKMGIILENKVSQKLKLP